MDTTISEDGKRRRWWVWMNGDRKVTWAPVDLTADQVAVKVGAERAEPAGPLG